MRRQREPRWTQWQVVERQANGKSGVCQDRVVESRGYVAACHSELSKRERTVSSASWADKRLEGVDTRPVARRGVEHPTADCQRTDAVSTGDHRIDSANKWNRTIRVDTRTGRPLVRGCHPHESQLAQGLLELAARPRCPVRSWVVTRSTTLSPGAVRGQPTARIDEGPVHQARAFRIPYTKADRLWETPD